MLQLLQSDPLQLVRVILALVLGFTIHEFAHARTALFLGDPTARDEGRTSLNPIHHIDLMGFVFIIIAGFGWAKPVMFRRENLKNPRRDELLIAAAGPLSNFAIAILLVAILAAWVHLAPLAGLTFPVAAAQWFFTFAIVNLMLGIFNSLPIPPLDGSHLLTAFLPEQAAAVYARVAPAFVYALFAVFLIGSFLHLNLLPVGPAANWVFNLLTGLFGLGTI